MSILIKVRYSDCKFASFFMERDEISFVSLVKKIKENCISLSHLEATSMRIKYKDEDDDLVNLRHDSAAVKEMPRCSRDVQGQEFRKVFLYAAELDSPAVVPNRSERNQRCQTEPGASCLPPRQLFEAASPQSAQPHQQTPLDKLKFDLAENVQVKRVLVQSAEEELSRLTGEQNDLQLLSALKGRVCGVCHKHGPLRPRSGADLEIFKRGGPEAIIFKIQKEGAQNLLKWLLNAHFSRFLINLLQIFHQKGGPGPLP